MSRAKELTENERLHVQSIRELVESRLFEAVREQEDIWFPLADFDPLSETRADWAGVRLGVELKDHALRFESLSCAWSSADAALDIHGEFCLPHLYMALIRDAPRYNDLATDREQVLLDQLRMIDHAPRRATGEATFIRVEPHRDSLEIWYQDRYLFDARDNSQGFLRMELDYVEYLDTLRMTKGAFGWQMLFVDGSLRGNGFRPHVANLRNMLRTFPQVFPQYDYAPLAVRLEARL